VAEEHFDYVVVGAGSAGCAVAARLSEDPAARVLVLEAGPPVDIDEVTMPAAFPNLFRTRWDWNYQTVPQVGLGGRSAYWPRMKAVGGCSSMNAMIYLRGHPADFDGWVRDFGAVGWSYANLLPYFVRAETNSRLGPPLHGTSGPLHVEDRRYTHPLVDAWIANAVRAGLPANDDFNGVELGGVGRYQVTCHNGRRWSTAKAYLEPALGRPNLTLRTNALTTRVLLDGTRATGVAYLHGGAEHRVRADAEVVLAGGAVNSPQLLMLSGIGPSEHLRSFGIATAVDLPGVGANLHDHPAAPLVWRTHGTTDLAVDLLTPLRAAAWQLTGHGPMTSNIAEGGGFVTTRSDLEAPDLQFHLAATAVYDHGFHESRRQRAFTVAPTVVDVASRGTLRLRGVDPRWRPVLDPGYFSERTDLAVMKAGARLAIELTRAGTFGRFVERPHLHASDTLDDAALEDYLAEHTQTLYHPVGTCAMGNGVEAVVDPELRVRGVQGLRVADASVMPRIVRANTNAATIMIGEKAADLIRGCTARRAGAPVAHLEDAA
jgi:choline dehydrogenase